MAQEVIKQALLNQKLAPSIHSKLVAFQKKQQEKKEKTQSPPPPTAEEDPAQKLEKNPEVSRCPRVVIPSVGCSGLGVVFGFFVSSFSYTYANKHFQPRKDAKESAVPSECPSKPLSQPPSGHPKRITEEVSPRKMEDDQR